MELELPLKKSAASSEIYLDYAGMAPVVQEVVAALSHVLASQPLGNPHSGGHSSHRAQSILSQGRACILDFFGASPLEYYVVFTAGATASVKLVGEAFQWTSKSVFAYTLENHTSVVGLRNLAVGAGATESSVFIGGAGLVQGKKRGQVGRQRPPNGKIPDDPERCR